MQTLRRLLLDITNLNEAKRVLNRNAMSKRIEDFYTVFREYARRPQPVLKTGLHEVIWNGDRQNLWYDAETDTWLTYPPELDKGTTVQTTELEN